MPIYEYKCEGCGETFEIIQKFSDEPLTTHEKCGGHVHRLLSAPAFQFKGTGWYITDYAKGGGSSPSKGEPGKSDSGDSSSKSSGDTSTKTEAKTESKSESKPASGGSDSSSSSSSKND